MDSDKINNYTANNWNNNIIIKIELLINKFKGMKIKELIFVIFKSSIFSLTLSITIISIFSIRLVQRLPKYPIMHIIVGFSLFGLFRTSLIIFYKLFTNYYKNDGIKKDQIINNSNNVELINIYDPLDLLSDLNIIINFELFFIFIFLNILIVSRISSFKIRDYIPVNKKGVLLLALLVRFSRM